MKRRRIWGILVLLAVTLAVLPAGRREPPAEPTEYEQLLAASPVAPLTGEPASPDGRFTVRTVGRSEHYVSGYCTPERLEVVDADGEVLWSDMGYLTQSALWAPDGRYLALAYGGRTWNAVRIFETDSWSSWEYTLPEYTFLTEEWGAWVENRNCLDVTADGVDGRRTCRVTLFHDPLEGHVRELTRETLAGEWDFNGDGMAETVEVISDPDSGSYELLVWRHDGGEVLWSAEANTAHLGWVSVFSLEVEGRDCLLVYVPAVGTGIGCYTYRLFTLDAEGGEQVLRENTVEFDLNFGSPLHQSFDPAAIAAFLEEVHAYLADSRLLLSTEGGEAVIDGEGAAFRGDMFFWDDFCPYREDWTLEENLRNYAETHTAARS